jgi:uncharacterized repeat protein (TIGR01451 family)
VRKIFFTQLIVSLVAFASKAQVIIPDLVFKQKLLQTIPSCFVNNLLDTTCAKTIKTLNVNSSQWDQWENKPLIKNLKGIEYFTNLETLNCNYSGIDTILNLPNSLVHIEFRYGQLKLIKAFPKSLTYIDVSSSVLTILPDLPVNLTYLDCTGNKLVSLPELPKNLETLYANGNQLTSIPNLPASLKILRCGHNKLTDLPVLPLIIDFLDCWDNQIISLPNLPQTLRKLWCHSNKLTILPELPESLLSLYCDDNQLSKLPTLPNSITNFSCATNKISKIDFFPPKLKELGLSNNLFTSLPKLPDSLNSFGCNRNPLQCVPFLPKKLSYLVTDLKCLPNIPPLLSTELPICTTKDSIKNCLTYPKIYGTAFFDENKNGLKENDEPFATSVTIQINPQGYIIKTNDSGFYNIAFDSLGTYSLTTINPSSNYSPFTSNFLLNNYGQTLEINLPLAKIKPAYVYIPDSNFRSLLKSKYPSCFVNDSLDSDCYSLKSAKNLDCSNRNISSLSGIHHFQALDRLYCSDNKLTSFPTMPPKLTYLDCSHNPITSFSQFSTMTLSHLDCEGCKLSGPFNYNQNNSSYSYLNLKSNDLIFGFTYNRFCAIADTFYVYGNILQGMAQSDCLPSEYFKCYGEVSDIGMYNQYSCNTYTISGFAYIDKNRNRIFDYTDEELDGAPVYITPYYQQLNYYSKSNSPFYYNILDSYGFYTLTPGNTAGYKPLNGYSKEIDVQYNTGFSNENCSRYSNFDFNCGDYSFPYVPFNTVQPDLLTDLQSVNSRFLAFAPTHTFLVTVHNFGAKQTTDIILSHDTNFVYNTSDKQPDIIKSGQLIWNNVSIDELSKVSWNIKFDIKHVLPIGYVAKSTINAIVTNDATPSDNAYTLIETVIGSFDPNDKHVSKEKLLIQELSKPDYLTYTIRFQNVGNTYAEKVVVTDLIDNNLDIKTIETISQSDSMTWIVNKDRTVTWTFDNIYLLDSSSNEAESHGFVKYRIKPISTLKVGDEIKNTANIYFDYNPAIVTNTTVTKIVAPIITELDLTNSEFKHNIQAIRSLRYYGYKWAIASQATN